MTAPPPLGWWTLWSGKGALRKVICVHLCWSIYIVVYYGMLLNIRAFSREHLEVNTVVAGLCEIIGTFIGLYLIMNTKRKWLWSGLFNVFAGFIALCCWFVPTDLELDPRVALLMLTAMVSKIAISSTLAILTTCTVELVPAEKRKILSFSTTCWARFWLLGAPFVGALIIFGQLVPQSVYVGLAILGGFITAFITSDQTWKKTNVKENNMTTFSQIGHVKDVNGSYLNPAFTSTNKSHLPIDPLVGIWTTKNHDETFAK